MKKVRHLYWIFFMLGNVSVSTAIPGYPISRNINIQGLSPALAGMGVIHSSYMEANPEMNNQSKSTKLLSSTHPEYHWIQGESFPYSNSYSTFVTPNPKKKKKQSPSLKQSFNKFKGNIKQQRVPAQSSGGSIAGGTGIPIYSTGPTTRPRLEYLPSGQGQYEPYYEVDHESWGTPPSPIEYLKTKQWNEGMGKCDGKMNLIQDLGILAIATGGIGTFLSIFTASYTSVVSNTISFISAAVGFLVGVPSAIITYLAASDRLSYSLANVLSIISFANTFFGMWSIDFGNKDILTSQLANGIGLFSLVLSIVTAFPSLFDESVVLLGAIFGKRGEVKEFVRNYGCSQEPTVYQHFNQWIENL